EIGPGSREVGRRLVLFLFECAGEIEIDLCLPGLAAGFGRIERGAGARQARVRAGIRRVELVMSDDGLLGPDLGGVVGREFDSGLLDLCGSKAVFGLLPGRVCRERSSPGRVDLLLASAAACLLRVRLGLFYACLLLRNLCFELWRIEDEE